MSLFGKQKPSFGEPAAWWSGLTASEMMIFMLGFYSAMGERCTFLSDIAQTPSEVLQHRETDPAMVRSLFQSAANMCNYSGISPVDMAAHLTAFYADSRNARIGYASAIQMLRGKLSGESSDFDDEIQRMRNASH